MLKTKSSSVSILSGIVVSSSLVACGGSGSSFFTGLSNLDLSKIAVEVSDIFDLADAGFAFIDFFEFLGSGTTQLNCVTGSSTSTFDDNNTNGTFDSGDVIRVNALNCVTNTGEVLSGSLEITSSTDTSTFVFTSFGVGSDVITGDLALTPTNDYDLANGTGSVAITVPTSLSIAEQGITNTLSNLIADFSLAGSNYTYEIDFDWSSSRFNGSVSVDTTLALMGTISNIAGDFVPNPPTTGNMTITLPDLGEALIDAASGSDATYNLTLDGQMIEVDWATD